MKRLFAQDIGEDPEHVPAQDLPLPDVGLAEEREQRRGDGLLELRHQELQQPLVRTKSFLCFFPFTHLSHIPEAFACLIF